MNKWIEKQKMKGKPGEALRSYGVTHVICGRLAEECQCDLDYERYRDEQISRR